LAQAGEAGAAGRFAPVAGEDSIAPWTGSRSRVEVLTEARFFPVFEGLPFVGRLWTPQDLRISPERFDRVVDLQATLGSRRQGARAGPVRSVATRAAARRWVVLWGDRWPRPSIPHAAQRYAEAAGIPAADVTPEVAVSPGDEEQARRLAPATLAAAAGRRGDEPPRPPDARMPRSGRAGDDDMPVAALIASASRRSKAYPRDQMLEVGRRLAAHGYVVWWVEAPGEAAPAEEAWPAIPGARVLRLPLGALKAALARCRLAVSADSGPMHLAAALGVPVLGVFGSSVPAFGFAPIGRRTAVAQVEGLACRPCGVHGRNRCWLGHWRCIRDLEPALVAAAALDLASERT